MSAQEAHVVMLAIYVESLKANNDEEKLAYRAWYEYLGKLNVEDASDEIIVKVLSAVRDILDFAPLEISFENDKVFFCEESPWNGTLVWFVSPVGTARYECTG